MQQANKGHDLFFIRHGDSMKNTAAEEYRVQRNLPFDWELFVQDPVFIKTVTHNPDLIDCHLSPKGIKQCQQAAQKLKDFHPDLILCSPLQRALQTTRFLFKGRTCPRIVEPLLSETFKHSSEVCKSIEVKKKEFPQFDFSKVEAEGQFWFIKNDSYENQKKYFEFLKEVHLQGAVYRETTEKIVDFMNNQKMREQPSNVRERSRKIKAFLSQYQKKYSKIAIVSHFYTIKFLNTTEFSQESQSIDKIHMQNCQILSTSLEEISKYN